MMSAMTWVIEAIVKLIEWMFDCVPRALDTFSYQSEEQQKSTLFVVGLGVLLLLFIMWWGLPAALLQWWWDFIMGML